MASEWPATLQQKLLEAGFGLGIGSTAIETEMDIALPKKRQRFTKGIDSVSCSIHLEVDLYDTFYNFYNITLAGGVGYFLFDHPITGVEREWQFIGEPGLRTLGGRTFSISMSWRLIP